MKKYLVLPLVIAGLGLPFGAGAKPVDPSLTKQTQMVYRGHFRGERVVVRRGYSGCRTCYRTYRVYRTYPAVRYYRYYSYPYYRSYWFW